MKRSSMPYYLFATLVLIYTLFPFYWAVVTSLKTGSEIFSVDLLPRNPTFRNYVSIFSEQPFGENLLNSLIVASACVIISLIVGILAAYAMARIEFRGRRILLITFLGVSMFPQIAVLAGLFELIRSLNLYNHWLGLSLSYLIFTLPFTVWILMTFVRSLPIGIEEAAILDGASPWKILWKLIIPLISPAFVTTGILAFIFAWNEFLFALTFTLTHKARTVPVAIALISGSSQYELPWASIMAASVTVTVPLVILVLVFQRKIVSGLTSGAIKG